MYGFCVYAYNRFRKIEYSGVRVCVLRRGGVYRYSQGLLMVDHDQLCPETSVDLGELLLKWILAMVTKAVSYTSLRVSRSLDFMISSPPPY